MDQVYKTCLALSLYMDQVIAPYISSSMFSQLGGFGVAVQRLSDLSGLADEGTPLTPYVILHVVLLTVRVFPSQSIRLGLDKIPCMKSKHILIPKSKNAKNILPRIFPTLLASRLYKMNEWPSNYAAVYLTL